MRKPHALLKRAILLLCSAWTIWAAPVIPTSYSLANGEEGYWIYQDTTYLPCPASSCTTSGAPLAGGTGMLTDGFTPAFSWIDSGQAPATSIPWLGWSGSSHTITFNFSALQLIGQVGLYLDNTPGLGDVRLPGSVDIAAQNYDFTEDPTFGPRWVIIDIPDVTTNALSITLNSDQGTWMMLSEVSFDDTPDVPEPGTIGLLLSGLGLFVACRLRKPA
jgi:hypothetical protein